MTERSRAPRRTTRTAAFGASKREGHDSRPFYERFAAPVVSDDETIVAPSFVDRIVVGDARDMSALASGSVALVVTSPPYFAGKAYEQEMGTGHIPGSYVEYLQMLRDVFAECVRVLQPGGRIAVNVANLGRRPYRSLAADVGTILQDDLRLLLRGEIVWLKQKGASGNCAWGSFQQPANPVLRDLTERVVVASKGRFDRALSTKDRAEQGLPSVSTMTRDEFMEATLDVWEIPPESASRVGHPAPFPVALPERLIHLYTYAGELVLDPFMGSGSTAVAAVRTGRHFVGFETDTAYAEAAAARVASEQPARQVQATTDRAAEPFASGRGAKDLARELLTDAGFGELVDNVKITTDVAVSLVGVDAAGRRVLFEVAGGRTSNRPGLQRADVLWRSIAKGAVVHAVDPGARYCILTFGLPSAVAGGKALAAVTGPDSPVSAVVDLLAPGAPAALRALHHPCGGAGTSPAGVSVP